MKTFGLTRDPSYWFLCTNAFLVLAGYALAVSTNMAPVPAMQYMKYAVLLLSFVELLRKSLNLLRLIFHCTQGVHVLSLLIICSCLLSGRLLETISRALTFVLPFLYIIYATGYLLLRYPVQTVLNALIRAFHLIYSLPVLFFTFFTGKLGDTDIYRIASENQGSLFVSNHYGWAGIIVLVTGIDLLKNSRFKPVRGAFTASLCLAGLYLVFVSGSRSSWLSLCIVMLLFLFRYNRARLAAKLTIISVPVLSIFIFLQDPHSAINRRLEKTKIQLKKGEPRQQTGLKMLRYFNANPALYVKGIGAFNKTRISTITGAGGYHNSYLDILFGCGIPIFLVFIYLMALRPMRIYMSWLSRHYLFLPPLLIIPFFESNLTGGQFLFFPWMVMTLTLSHMPVLLKLKYRATDLLKNGTTTSILENYGYISEKSNSVR